MWECPKCTYEVDWQYDCPGYMIDGTLMVCYPPKHCGNATFYYCESNACNWWYRYPDERQYDDMGIAPAWLDEANRYTQFPFSDLDDDDDS